MDNIIIILQGFNILAQYLNILFDCVFGYTMWIACIWKIVYNYIYYIQM